MSVYFVVLSNVPLNDKNWHNRCQVGQRAKSDLSIAMACPECGGDIERVFKYTSRSGQLRVSKLSLNPKPSVKTCWLALTTASDQS